MAEAVSAKPLQNCLQSRELKCIYLTLIKKDAEETVKEITSEGGQANAIQCDVSNQQQVKEIVDAIAKKSGAIHILVNNAGVAHVGTAETTSEDDFNRLVECKCKRRV